MQGTPHRIRSQRWVVRTDSAEDGFAWRRFLRDHGEAILSPVLEEAFDEAAGGDRVLYIPRIELKIRMRSGDNLEEKLSDLVLGQLRDQLRRGCWEEPPSDEKLPRRREFTAQESRFKALLHYLRTGSVPWHAMAPSPSDTAMALAETCRDERARLLEHLRSHREAAPFYFRLLQVQTVEEGLSLVHALLDRIQEQTRQAVLQFLTSLLTADQRHLSRHGQLHLASVLLSESLSQRGVSILPRAFSSATETLLPGDRTAYDRFVSSLPEPAGSLFRQEEPGAYLADELSVPWSPPVRTMKETLQPAEIGSSNAPGPVAELFPLTVHQAGLVLLHRFMARFFENTGVKEKGTPELSPFALPRAAALLFFIATGRDEVLEYELGLVKVLLGLRPETPLPVGEGFIGQEEREEAEALLRSVIEHWSVLKNTSIRGLRSSFLQRQGLLRDEEEGWRLQVERKPFDLLLGHLPWGISIVRLPWMKRPIHTEW